MLLLEILTKTVPYHYDEESEQYYFEVGDITYTARHTGFYMSDFNEAQEILDLDESQRERYNDIIGLHRDAVIVEFSSIKKGGGESSFKITGTGNAYLVFATMKKMIEDLRSRASDAMIVINADKREPSRVKLYRRLVKGVNSVEFEGSKDIHFFLL